MARSQRRIRNSGVGRPPRASVDIDSDPSEFEHSMAPATRNFTPTKDSSGPASQLYTGDQDVQDNSGNWDRQSVLKYPNLFGLSPRKHIGTTPVQSGTVSRRPSSTLSTGGDSVYASRPQFASPTPPAQAASPFASPPVQTMFSFAGPAQPLSPRFVDPVDTQAFPLSSDNATPPSTAAPEGSVSDLRFGGRSGNEEAQQHPIDPGAEKPAHSEHSSQSTRAADVGRAFLRDEAQQQPPTLGFSAIDQVETAPVINDIAVNSTTLDEQEAVNDFLNERVQSLLHEAQQKMDTESFKAIADQVLPTLIGVPREVQLPMNNSRLRITVMIVLGAISKFDAKQKTAGAQGLSEKTQMSTGTATFMPDGTAISDGSERHHTVDEPFRWPANMGQEQNHMRSMAKDVRELKDSVVASNIKAMPALLERLANELEGINATKKELVALLKQKQPVQNLESEPSTEPGAGSKTRAKGSQGSPKSIFGPFGSLAAQPKENTSTVAPIVGTFDLPDIAAAPRPASKTGAPCSIFGPPEQAPAKHAQIAALRDQLCSKEAEISSWKKTCDEKAEQLQTVVADKDEEIFNEDQDKQMKMLDQADKIARMDGLIRSKDAEIKRLQNELKTRDQLTACGLLDHPNLGTSIVFPSGGGVSGAVGCPSGEQPASRGHSTTMGQPSSAVPAASGFGGFSNVVHQPVPKRSQGSLFGAPGERVPGGLFGNALPVPSTSGFIFGNTAQEGPTRPSGTLFGGLTTEPSPDSAPPALNQDPVPAAARPGRKTKPGVFPGGAQHETPKKWPSLFEPSTARANPMLYGSWTRQAILARSRASPASHDQRPVGDSSTTDDPIFGGGTTVQCTRPVDLDEPGQCRGRSRKTRVVHDVSDEEEL